MLNDKKLPEKTIERLSSYRRALLGLSSDGLTHIYSHQLAQMLGITAVQVRRDLMLIGFSSGERRGYDIGTLQRHISSIIDAERVQKVAFVGMGKLAQAITHYFSARNSININIAAIFDNDPQKIGKEYYGVRCHGADDFEQIIISEKIDIVILSCPYGAVNSYLRVIENSKVSGVLNFTSASLTFSRDVYVENYDILTLFEKVVYFSK